MLCSPWLAAADVELCDPDATTLPRAIEVATWLLYWATGRQFPGICTDVVRPCQQATAGIQMLDYPDGIGGARPLPTMGGCGCSGEVLCGCTAHSTVRLPGSPVIDVSATIDGAAVPVRIVNDQWIIRTDGGSWPCCQNLLVADGDPGAFTVSYRYGRLPPPPVIAAVEFLACQFVASWCTDPDGCGTCVLPQRLTQLTYEGATMATLDPFDFLENGTFGIPLVDYAVRGVNPTGASRPSVVRTPRDYLSRPARVR